MLCVLGWYLVEFFFFLNKRSSCSEREEKTTSESVVACAYYSEPLHWHMATYLKMIFLDNTRNNTRETWGNWEGNCVFARAKFTYLWWVISLPTDSNNNHEGSWQHICWLSTLWGWGVPRRIMKTPLGVSVRFFSRGDQLREDNKPLK